MMRPFLMFALMFALMTGPALADGPVDYAVTDAAEITEPLTDAPVNQAAGAAVFAAAGCAGCHRAKGFPNAPTTGPDLAKVAARLTSGAIRLMIVAPDVRTPGAEMPAYYAVGEYGEAPDALVGRTRLSAMEIEQIVAWLASQGR